jgi:hypothetical protein
MKFSKIFMYYKDDYVVCVKLLFSFLVQHNKIMLESSDIVFMCACTCMHLLVGNVWVHRDVHLKRMYIYAVNISFVLS